MILFRRGSIRQAVVLRFWAMVRVPTHILLASLADGYYSTHAAKATSDYEAMLAEEFDFKKGDVIAVTAMPDDGWWRGELQDMWTYTEDGSLDTKDVIVEVDGDGNVIKAVRHEKKNDDDRKKEDDHEKSSSDDKASSGEGVVSKEDANAHKSTDHKGHDVFVFVIRAPGDDELYEDEC